MDCLLIESNLNDFVVSGCGCGRMVLTEKQRKDLHLAMYEYLVMNGFESCAKALAQDTGVDLASEEDANKGGGVPLLEKKWTSVVRLQRKVLELESKVEELQQELRNKGKGNLASSSSSSTSGSFTLSSSSSAHHTLKGHRSPVTCIVFHPVYSLLVSTSEDGTIKVWDHETGEFEKTLKGHTNAVQHACFSENGELLASASADLSIKLWDFKEKYECIRTLMGHDHNVCGVAFLKGSTELISCSRDKTLRMWEVSTGYCVKTLYGHSEWVRKVAVHVETNSVASCSNDNSIIVWSLQSGSPQTTLTGHEHVVETIAFSSAAADKALTRKQKLAEQIKENGSLNNSGNTNGRRNGGLFLLSGSRDRTVKLWEISTGVCLHTFTVHESWVRGVSFEPNGEYGLSVSEDKTIKILDLAEKRCIRTIQNAHDHFLTCISVHPSLPVVATGSVDTNVKIWSGSG